MSNTASPQQEPLRVCCQIESPVASNHRSDLFNKPEHRTTHRLQLTHIVCQFGASQILGVGSALQVTSLRGTESSAHHSQFVEPSHPHAPPKKGKFPHVNLTSRAHPCCCNCCPLRQRSTRPARPRCASSPPPPPLALVQPAPSRSGPETVPSH